MDHLLKVLDAFEFKGLPAFLTRNFSMFVTLLIY